jgi:molybdopterin-binding protein
MSFEFREALDFPVHRIDEMNTASNGEVNMLSARNQFDGKVKSVKLGNVMAEVVVAVGDIEIVSVITRGSAESLALKAGDAVTAIIKSTEVIIDK